MWMRIWACPWVASRKRMKRPERLWKLFEINNCFGCSTVALISRFREHISVCAFETHQLSFSSGVYFHPPPTSDPSLIPFPLRVKTLLILLCYDLVTHIASPLFHISVSPFGFSYTRFPCFFIRLSKC